MRFRFPGRLGVAFSPMKIAALCLGLVASLSGYAQPEDHEDWTARFQTTYAWQKKPAMHARYSGQNSLDAGKEQSYTATATAYLGFRSWQGGELYLNPEVTQGVPFSGLSGSAGFTNGELTRTAGTNPKPYRQRLFLRQTWGLGGGDEKIEADLNQMAGTVDKNRIVLTVGNFSTLDVFDENAYAKDPRVHFMNAGFMAPLSYDYAADARGFGWGFAAEWYQDDWAFRFGRMTGPKEPNMLPIDYRIGKHYGDQVEVEHSHTLAGQPGKVRLLGWRNRANLASFKDALDYLNAYPAADRQAIFAVRNDEKIKYGVGINVEQAITDNLGFFLRAMKADGRTETYAFTETDGSLGTGFALKGAAWGRARDTVGIGYLRNTISKDRRRYLEAGGISFFIGDGALRYRPEQVVETYYSLNVWKAVFLTADYQRMGNPAYNADRGPANFFAMRFHAEF
ncbi:MAG: Carbohydrate-selective porin OprB [Rhodocyclaceae bacterium]|nr:Carbohydrate-selective porin OprB [Rhodocyclaceae bacterium]